MASTSSDGSKAGVTALAGLGSLTIFAVASLVFGLSAATGVSPIGGGDPTLITYAGMYGVAPVIASFGAALPARLLGAGWTLSLLVGAAVVTAFFWTALGVESLDLARTVFVLAPAVVTLVGLTGSGMQAKGTLSILAASAILLIAALLGFASYLVLAAGWVILPAVAGFFQPHQDRSS